MKWPDGQVSDVRESKPEWLIVVAPTNESSANLAFQNWKDENLAWSQALTDNDVLKDTIRGGDGHDYIRYRVRSSSEPEG